MMFYFCGGGLCIWSNACHKKWIHSAGSRIAVDLYFRAAAIPAAAHRSQAPYANPLDIVRWPDMKV
jgi:hypothetical protein